MLLANSGHYFITIFFDYVSTRDTIFGMYIHMIARNDIRYIHLHSFIIIGYKTSITDL